MKKGDIAIETVVYAVIIVFALAIIMIFVFRLVPSFNDIVEGMFSKMKEIFCKTLPSVAKWVMC